jgi:hypothetical protein
MNDNLPVFVIKYLEKDEKLRIQVRGGGGGYILKNPSTFDKNKMEFT